MKIQLVSDIHLDALDRHMGNIDSIFNLVTNVNDSDVLVIAGDLCELRYRETESMKRFVDYVSANWKYVIEIPGNHTFYATDLNNKDVKRMMGQFVDMVRPNYFHTNNTTIRIEGVAFVCSTMWTNIPDSKRKYITACINDYRQCRGLTTADTNKLHSEAVKFIEGAVSLTTNDVPCVVVTHHIPSWCMVGFDHVGSPLNPAFVVDMDDIIKKYNIRLWLHGHSHSQQQRYINNTCVVRNPIGYPTGTGFEVNYINWEINV